MAILESNEEYQANPIQMEDHQQTTQLQSLLRLMKISNEFVAIKEYMQN